ncbi:MAG: rod-binding protein [Nitrospirales bacterium]|nr:rod-binding protein [Nitrospira sp.]MDR4502334.1 rod-binding protein [Nitrospirales bacterium]
MLDGILGLGNVPPVDALQYSKIEKFERLQGRENIRQAAQEYESYFLAYLMKMMRNTVPKGSLTSNPMGETFYSFYDEEIAKRAAQAGGVGLADFVLSSLAQEGAKAGHMESETDLEESQ